MPQKEFISWNSYIQLIEKLANKIQQDKHQFDSIICINRGGLIIGRVLSDLLSLPIGVISAKGYEKGTTDIKNITINPTISSIDPIGKNILLVDDLVDSGKTMELIFKHLKKTIKKSKTQSKNN